MKTENTCRYCKKVIYGLIPCNCEKSVKYRMLWNKSITPRRKGKRPLNSCEKKKVSIILHTMDIGKIYNRQEMFKLIKKHGKIQKNILSILDKSVEYGSIIKTENNRYIRDK